MGLVNRIVDGISIRLNETFNETPGEDCEIYSEEVRQGLREPCFFIFPLNPSQSPMPGSRYRRINPFDVHYFPSRRGGNAGMDETAERLFEALEYISVNGDLVRGVNMHYEKVGGVLHFFVEYNLFVSRPEIKIQMEEMTETVGTKE